MTVKKFVMLQDFYFKLFIKEYLKSLTVSTKLLISTTVFNIDNNNKCFVSTKSAYEMISEGLCDAEDYLLLKIQLCHLLPYILTFNISIENCFSIVMLFFSYNILWNNVENCKNVLQYYWFIAFLIKQMLTCWSLETLFLKQNLNYSNISLIRYHGRWQFIFLYGSSYVF